MSDLLRTRIALAALSGGASGALTYALVRAYVYLRGGGGAMTLLLRQQTIGYFQALAVSAFVGLSVFLACVALHERSDETDRLEARLGRVLVPVLALSGVAYFLLP